MALPKDVLERYWRTDKYRGYNIYSLISNNPLKPSVHDPVIGTMQTAEAAEDIVEAHNLLVEKFGRRYITALQSHE